MKSELQYIVNKEKKTVTCIASDCQSDLIKLLEKKTSSVSDNINDLLKKNKFRMPSVIVATARCHPNDIFDEEKGKEIARKKMRYKYSSIMSNILIKYINKIKEVDNFLWGIYLKSTDNMNEKKEIFIKSYKK